jgi:tryptophan 2,3-dioxygenase
MELLEPSPMPRVAATGCPLTRWSARFATVWQRVAGAAHLRRPGGGDTDSALARVAAWRAQPAPEGFPYDEVIAALRHTGKHFAPRELLASLAAARAGLPRDTTPAVRRLDRFLATALDKRDERYDNPSYLALDGLELPAGASPEAAARRDRLVALLIADALRFELLAEAGEAKAPQPEMRPQGRIIEKRCRHGLLVLAPVLARSGTSIAAHADSPIAAARDAVDAVLGGMTADERLMLQLTLLPVSRIHDECLFIRVLQSYEATFAYAAVELAAAAAALGGSDAGTAVAALDGAARVLGESSPLFSLIGTMQPQAFLAFRQYTDGASAIQSRSYKRMESTCRKPDRERIDSSAYLSVPEVRAAVLAGAPTIDAALQAAALPAEQAHAVRDAMDRFASALLRWRRTHHGVAGRMLGERRGTGDTEGSAYLANGMTIPVFAAPRCPLRGGAGFAAD